MAAVIGNNDFGRKLADALGLNFSEFEQRIFPDGESCPRILSDVDEDVILINHMRLPLEPNRYFIETLLLIKNLQELGAENIDVVMPYFVYSRQDKIFRDGEPFSAKFVLETLHKSGVSRFFTVSSHAEREKEKLTLSKMPAFNVNGFVAIGNYLKKKNFSQPIVVGPDNGAEHFAKTVADILECDYMLLEKHRDLDTGEIETKRNANVKGKEVVIVDDIISSGGTILNAIELLKDSAAKDVFIYVVHLVSEKSIGKISPYVKEFLVSDTIDTPVSKISIIEQLAEMLKP